MNGIIVSLLMLCMTGIVSGQQIDRSSPFGQPPLGGPTTNQPQIPGAPSSGPSSQISSQTAPFEIEISSSDIDGLKQGAVLRSAITPQDPVTGELLPPSIVSGVSLVHSNNVDKKLSSAPLHGTNLGDGHLQFDLEDQDLVYLQTMKLSFEFSQRDRGQIKQVSFRYIAPDRTANASTTPFSAPPTGQAGYQLKLPAPPLNDARQQDSMSPSQAGRVDSTANSTFNPAASPLDPAMWKRTPTPETVRNTGFPRPGPITNNSINHSGATDSWQSPQQTLAPIRPNTVPITANSIALEREKILRTSIDQDRRSDILDQRESDLEQNIRDLKAQQFRDSHWTPAANGSYNQSNPILPDRSASLDSKAGLDGGVPNRQTGQGTLNAGVRGTLNNETSTNSAFDPTNKDPESVPKNNKTVLTMFVMLMCSFGLNAYLGLVSRGFYVRYNELSDELRETFTTSV